LLAIDDDTGSTFEGTWLYLPTFLRSPRAKRVTRPRLGFKISVGLGFRVLSFVYLPRREAFEPPRQRPPGRAPGGNTYTTLYTHRHQRRRRRVGERRGVKGNVRLDGRTKMSAPRLLNRRGRTIRDNILIHYYFLHRHTEIERQR